MSSPLITGTAFAALLLSGPGLPEEPLRSGPPVGEANRRGAFFPEFVAGQYAGDARRCPV